MTPQSAAHAAALELTQEALQGVLGSAFRARPQLPLALDPDSEPEPDLTVVRGAARDRWDQRPTSAALVVEISDATLEFDRNRKKSPYAQHGIPEYWVLNLKDHTLEVYREPHKPSGGEATYGLVRKVTDRESIAPLASPTTPIRIADLLR